MILFSINPFLSHFLPTIPVAKALSDNGYEVGYLGFDKSREWVENKGFHFLSISKWQDEDIKRLKREHDYERLEVCFKDIHDEISEKVSKLSNVSLVLFHVSRFDVFYLPIHTLGINVVSYTTSSGAVSFNGYIPPATSSFIPSLKWDIRNIFLWGRRYIRKCNDTNWHKLRKTYPYSELSKVAKKEGIKWKFGIDGMFLDISHFKLGPREFEFNADYENKYAGLCVDYEDDEENNTYTPMKEYIYCSLGTMSYRYLKVKEFLFQFIALCKKHPEWKVLISLGNDNAENLFEDIPKNVEINKFVNQREILSKSLLAITHGGYGTIKECIYYEVPMVVCPSSYDQHGNAARVIFHKLGLRNGLLKKTWLERIVHRNIFKINNTILESQILQILSSTQYKNNIVELKRRILMSSDLNSLLAFLTANENKDKEKKNNV